MDPVIEKEFLSAEDVALLKRTKLKAFTEDEQEVFVRVCQRSFLDPFTNPPQIYATRRSQMVTDEAGEHYEQVMVIVTAINGLLAIADRTGDYDGSTIEWCGADGVWKPEWISHEYPFSAKCTVYHKKRKYPEVAIAHWAGYGEQVSRSNKIYVPKFWQRLPDFMLGKCARALGLRAAFPEVANLYIPEELGAESHEATEPKEKLPANVQYINSDKPIQPDPEKAELQAERKAEVAAGAENRMKFPASAVSPQPPAEEDDPFGVEQSAQSPAETADSAETGAAPSTSEEPAWRDHTITGIRDKRFFGRKIGELSEVEFNKIIQSWVPKIVAKWDEANDAQRLDAKVFQDAIASMDSGKIQ